MQTPATVSRTTLDWYDDLGAWARADSGSWLLLTLVDALGSQHDQTEQYTRDDAAHTGWGQLLDVNACPSVALPWLAQLAGVAVPVGSSDAQIRTLIQTQPNAKRGTVASIRAAAQALLTGTQRVDITERYPDPYSFQVVTYASETPSGPAVLAALVAAKPAGLVMTYLRQSGPAWNQEAANIWSGQGAATWNSESNLIP